MLVRDGADHARLRNPVAKTFTPKVIDRLRSHIEEIAHQLLDGLKGKDSIDLIEDYAFALLVIAELLGVPTADRNKFKEWSTALIVTLDPHVTPEQMTEAALISVELMNYFRVLLNERKVSSQDDLISDMARPS
jgi:cytochrome P450